MEIYTSNINHHTSTRATLHMNEHMLVVSQMWNANINVPRKRCIWEATRERIHTMFYVTNICTHCRRTQIELEERTTCPACGKRMIYEPANLKPCPLCHSSHTQVSVKPDGTKIECLDCSCSITQNSTEKAFIVWNTRPKSNKTVNAEKHYKTVFKDTNQAHCVSTYKIADIINGIY